MRKSRFTEEQIVAALKLAEASSVDEVAGRSGSAATRSMPGRRSSEAWR